MNTQILTIALAHAVEIIEMSQEAPLDIDQVATVAGICEALALDLDDVLTAPAIELIDPRELPVIGEYHV